MDKAYVIISMWFTGKQGKILNGTIYFNKESAKNHCEAANNRHQRQTRTKESPYKVIELGEFRFIN